MIMIKCNNSLYAWIFPSHLNLCCHSTLALESTASLRIPRSDQPLPLLALHVQEEDTARVSSVTIVMKEVYTSHNYVTVTGRKRTL